jgi:hypothetical protein
VPRLELLDRPLGLPDAGRPPIRVEAAGDVADLVAGIAAGGGRRAGGRGKPDDA